MHGLLTIGRALSAPVIRVWNYSVIAAWCAFSMFTGCSTVLSGPDGNTGGTGGTGLDAGGTGLDAGGTGGVTGGTGGVIGFTGGTGGIIMGTGGMYGPAICRSDQDCRDWHGGGNWYCDFTTTWPYCVQVTDEDAGSAEDAGAK